MIENVENKLKALSENNFYYKKLIPNSQKSYGVKIPELKKIAKQIAKEDYKLFLDNDPLDSFEMEVLYAFVLGYARDDISILLNYFDDFLPKIHDWAVCDSLCQTFKISEKYQKEVFDYLNKYLNSKNEFEVRVITVMYLSHFLNDEYIDLVINNIDSLCLDSYYSKMGAAWLIATIMAKYPDKCLDFMDKTIINDWTYNKSIQKMKESFRVSNEIKKRVEGLRRK